ncbi:MAG: tRNA (adenosine(37)-N6)-threonylcarbamoyltransferase complex ATPase subunit type 1 TsaE [bacterium]|nr:tRNA (adenosine(37)-N6)-threonylcarbamoyltransferase complex ATPase subunit type 1 TsaE [bacterium]
MKYISKSLEETKNIAGNVLKTLEKKERATVIALEGDLGAGKTAFSQAVGEILGVKETMQSPTYVIEKIYEINFKDFKHLIHIDAYRLEEDKELLHLGWEEIVSEPENLILIEWPERVSKIIPQDSIKINFEFIDETTREISTDLILS